MTRIPRLAAGVLAAATLGVVSVPTAAQAQQAPAYPPSSVGGEVLGTTFEAPPTAQLPRTGSDMGTATAIGLGALAVGGMLIVAGRRRARA